jgi:predicted phosphoribosyltransferase
VQVAGRTVVLADDGLSDPIAVAAATHGLRELGSARVIYAAPNASRALLASVKEECDECLLRYPEGAPVSAFVCDADFVQTTRFDVRSMVRRSRPDLFATAGP